EQPGGQEDGDASSSPRTPSSATGGGLAVLAGGDDEEAGRGADDATPAPSVTAAAAVVAPQSLSPRGDHGSARRPGAGGADANESGAAPLLELVESDTPAAGAVGDASADGEGGNRSDRVSPRAGRTAAAAVGDLDSGGAVSPPPR
ncbi:unnamed protein product, partial [Ectocarpus fasciculatus]